MARIRRKRTIAKHGKSSDETVYIVTSLSPDKATPERLLALVRNHWGIESLHWIRDMIFDEDRCRIRTGNGARMMATLRNLAVSLMRAVKPDRHAYARMKRELTARAHLTLQLIGA